MTRILSAALACTCLLPTAASAGREYVFPPDAGVVNVKDHGAAGDGVTDDTPAIRKAVAAGIERTGRYASPAFVYFPTGMYLVTGPIESRTAEYGWSGGWKAGMLLVGQSRAGSVIRLKDRCEGYGDPAKPKYVIAGGSESDKRTAEGDPPLHGGGNRAFRHSVIHLTVDTGNGNPGAVGIDYVASNRGTIEDVTIRSGDGQGAVGLALTRNWPGPALVKRLRVEGFDVGIKAAHFQYSMTFEHVELVGQRTCGVHNDKNALFFRDLRVSGRVPAVVNAARPGLIVLIDSVFAGEGHDGPAIRNGGLLFARNVKCPGHRMPIEDPRMDLTDLPGPNITEYASNVHTLGGAAGRSLHLPVEETPEFHTADLSRWASAAAHGATPGGKAYEGSPQGDDTAGIQAAIDSGKALVYLPNGKYTVTKTIILRGRVRKLMGMQSSISPPEGVQLDPLIRFEGCGGESVVIEHLRLNGRVEHASDKALAIRHCDVRGGVSNTAEGTGKLFIEDVIGRPGVRILHPQKVWLRQINPEWGFDPWIENHGGTLWVLGMKTEGKTTAIRAVGGRTELLGGLFYREPRWKGPGPETPTFDIVGGAFSGSYVMNGKAYPIHARYRPSDEPEAVPQTLTHKQVGARGPALLSAGAK